ncbi:MAG: DNA polymerase [Thermomicrobiales bacterium]
MIGVGFAFELDGEREVRLYRSWDEWYEDFWDLLKASKQNKRLRKIYAHNGAGFDWLSFIQWGMKRGLIDDLKYIFAGQGIGVDLHMQRVVIQLRDSYRLLPASLAKLCETFHTEHRKLDIPTLPHIQLAENPVLYWQYLQNDVLSLQEVIFSFWSSIYNRSGSIGELSMTLPALSAKLWRMTLKVSLATPSNKKLKVMERRAYTGGRTECYHSGTAQVSVYDANSEYPSVMIDNIFPVSYSGGFTTGYHGKHGLYDITYIQHDRTHKPVLRDEETDRFTYVGSGVYAQPEIERLLAMDGEITVKEGFVFVDVGNPFHDFIDLYWNTRLDALARGDEAWAFVCKILMNSLYGKFGQREDGYTLKLLTADQMIDLLRKKTPIIPAGAFTLVEESRHSVMTFVSIAAYITSYARLWLYDEMAMAQDAGANLYAVDTDSVHFAGDVILPTGKGLGQWKLEYRGECTFLGPKLYAQKDGKIKAKGFALRDSGIEYATYVDLAYGRIPPLRVTFGVFPTFREVLIQGKQSAEMLTRTRTMRATTPLRREGNT